MIRAVARRSWAAVTRSSASGRGGAGWSSSSSSRSAERRSPGSSRAAARSSAPRGRTRTSSTAASSGPRSLRAVDALVAIGGEDTLGVAARLHAEFGAPVVGVPKTIDNDLSGTDYTFGFDTAVSICTEAIDRLHTTAESHNRVMVVEVMGRHAGWIAVHSGIAGGADVDPDPGAAGRLRRRVRRDRAPHAKRQELLDRRRQRGLRAAGRRGQGRGRPVRAHAAREARRRRAAGEEIESRTGNETRVTVLGHIQRGGSPTARDRILATRFGLKAADLVARGQFGPDGGAPRRRGRRRAARPRRPPS